MKLLLLALFLAPPQDPPPREKASAFTYVRPRGWSRQDLDNKSVVLLAPGPDAQRCSLFIFSGQTGELNELVFHDQLLRLVTQGSRVDGIVDKAYRGNWQYSRLKTVTPQGQETWMILFTTRSDAHLESLLFAAATEQLQKTYRFAVERLITGIEFPDARPKPPAGPEWKAAPIPAKDLKIVGAWTVARMERTFSVDPKAGGVQQQHTVKVFVLFENKVAAKVDARQTGLIDSTFPAEGLTTMDVSSPTALANRRQFGRWSEDGGRIRIQWNEGPEDNVQRVNGDLKEANNTLWPAIKPIDGIRMEGTFVREVPFGPPGMLVLRKDGTFDADSVNETMGGKLVNSKFPEMGSGKYEFRKWSLILRFDTGFVQSIHVALDGDDPKSANTILINGYSFVREGTAAPGAPGGRANSATPAAAAPAGTAIHGLVIPVPPGWTRKDDPSGSVYLLPPQNQNSSGYFLLVMPSSRFQGTHWSAHKELLKIGLGWIQVTEVLSTIHNPDGPGLFVRSSAGGKIASGEVRELLLFTAAHDGVLEAIMVVNNPDLDAVVRILRGVAFKDPVRAATRPKVVEAYRRMNQKLYINPSGGAMTPGSLMYERIWLRSDGTADFTTWYTEGYAASPLALKLDPGLEDGHSGSWKAVGDKVHIVRHSGVPAEVYVRNQGSLFLGAQEWQPMPRVDGLRLSGRWSARSAPQETISPWYHWIDFTAEGRFKTEGGLLSHVAGHDLDAPRPPESGAGTYEIRDWTIFLKFDGGKTWSTDFSTLGRDPKDLSSILFRTYSVRKEK